LLGRDWAGARNRSERDDRDSLFRALEAALASDTVVVPVLLDHAEVSSEQLPPALSPLTRIAPVRATDDYWDEAVERIVGRVGEPAPRGLLARARHVRRRVKVGAGIGLVSSVVGILATFGIFEKTEPERGTLTVNDQPAVGLALDEYLRDFPEEGGRPPDYPVESDTEGYVYAVHVGLERAQSDNYGIHWTIRDPGTRRRLKPFAGLAQLSFPGLRFTDRTANGLHHVWVPCPDRDGLEYIVVFALVNEDRQNHALESAEGGKGDCRVIEE
jgi:hypothetical protein